MQKTKIAVFDSGVGGLSILEAIRQRWVGVECIYCSDNRNYPYGTKSEQEVMDCTFRATKALVEKYEPDVLVIACNTASTVALPHVRDQLTLPIVGVVPAIKPAGLRTRSKIIGLLATEATIKRPYTDDLIKQFASHCQVVRVGTSKLVDMAEAKLRGAEIKLKEVKEEILPLFTHALSIAGEDKKLDTVVLGCTHFPLLRNEINHSVLWPVDFLEPSEAIVERISTLMGAMGLTCSERTPSDSFDVDIRAVFTERTKEAVELLPYLKRIGLKSDLDYVVAI